MEDFISIYEGSNIQADILRNQLEDLGINVLLKSDSDAGLSAGFGSLDTCTVLISKSDLEKAEETINNFKEKNEA
jgi:hypothetical protein